jgi:uncharacterized protein
MTLFARNEPLTEAELDRLEEFLDGCAGGNAMNIEELDGFFAALVAGPEIVLPSEYLPEVFGVDMSDTNVFASLEEANEILALLMRHWNKIAATLSKGDVHVPILLNDENGLPRGNDWAWGFLHGSSMRRDLWAKLMDDEEHGGCLLPMLMLCHEHDPDPKMRPKPISAELRGEILVHLAAGLIVAYRYFREHEHPPMATRATEPRGAKIKIGRNDLCPCGSGKKYKRCCVPVIN